MIDHPGADGRWNVIAASVAGTKHGRSGIRCQDAHFYIQENNLLVAAVADGAGSASHADVGSSLAAKCSVQTVVDLLFLAPTVSDVIVESILKEALIATRTTLEDEAAKRRLELSDLATTLIIAVASDTFVVAAQVGDGAIVVLSADDEITTVTVPRYGAYINETTFLVSDDWPSATQYATFPKRTRGLAAFSDGLQLLALKLPEAIACDGFFRPLFTLALESQDNNAAKLQLDEFLTSERVNERTDDDKTLLIAGFR